MQKTAKYSVHDVVFQILNESIGIVLELMIYV